jgi:probable rRNA maturation factor
VAFTWAARPEGRPTARLRRLALAALGRLGVTEGEVGVLVCDDATIRALNRDFRHRNAATDVLSFGGGESEPGEPPYLGDVAISLDTALRQAGASGEPLLREVETLLLHALVHLMGYDHENDQGEMDALERRLRGELLT